MVWETLATLIGMDRGLAYVLGTYLGGIFTVIMSLLFINQSDPPITEKIELIGKFMAIEHKGSIMIAVACFLITISSLMLYFSLITLRENINNVNKVFSTIRGYQSGNKDHIATRMKLITLFNLSSFGSVMTNNAESVDSVITDNKKINRDDFKLRLNIIPGLYDMNYGILGVGYSLLGGIFIFNYVVKKETRWKFVNSFVDAIGYAFSPLIVAALLNAYDMFIGTQARTLIFGSSFDDMGDFVELYLESEFELTHVMSDNNKKRIDTDESKEKSNKAIQDNAKRWNDYIQKRDECINTIGTLLKKTLVVGLTGFLVIFFFIAKAIPHFNIENKQHVYEFTQTYAIPGLVGIIILMWIYLTIN